VVKAKPSVPILGKENSPGEAETSSYNCPFPFFKRMKISGVCLLDTQGDTFHPPLFVIFFFFFFYSLSCGEALLLLPNRLPPRL